MGKCFSSINHIAPDIIPDQVNQVNISQPESYSTSLYHNDHNRSLVKSSSVLHLHDFNKSSKVTPEDNILQLLPIKSSILKLNSVMPLNQLLTSSLTLTENSKADEFQYEGLDSNQVNLHNSCKLGDLDSVKNILESIESSNPSDIHLINSTGMWSSTPLIIALQYGHIPLIMYFLSNKYAGIINVNHVNDRNGSALLYACLLDRSQYRQEVSIDSLPSYSM